MKCKQTSLNKPVQIKANHHTAINRRNVWLAKNWNGALISLRIKLYLPRYCDYHYYLSHIHITIIFYIVITSVLSMDVVVVYTHHFSLLLPETVQPLTVWSY